MAPLDALGRGGRQCASLSSSQSLHLTCPLKGRRLGQRLSVAGGHQTVTCQYEQQRISAEARRLQNAQEAPSSSGTGMMKPGYGSSCPVVVPAPNPSRWVPGEGQSHHQRNGTRWPKKAELYIMRTDGKSCSRETVQASGCLSFEHPSTQQQLLVWKDRPKCVMVLKKLGDELNEEFVAVLKYLALEAGMNVVVEPEEHIRLSHTHPEINFLDTFSPDEARKLHEAVDFVTCLGGDGLVLHASSIFQGAIPPVVSFNMGSLGFLTNHSFPNFKQDLAGVIAGSEPLEACSPEGNLMRGVHITLRMRLECMVLRAGERLIPPVEVLNEVVVDRGSNPFLTKIECWEHDRLLTKVQADGIMLSTPTGSTAYSVAAGGSMVHPNVPAILLTPICAHSLSFRPVVLPDYAEIELRIPQDARCTAWVCFDGKQRQELQRGDSVLVRMSPNPVPTISKKDQTDDWFGSLERCFGWNDRFEQKPLHTYHPDDVSTLPQI